MHSPLYLDLGVSWLNGNASRHLLAVESLPLLLLQSKPWWLSYNLHLVMMMVELFPRRLFAIFEDDQPGPRAHQESSLIGIAIYSSLSSLPLFLTCYLFCKYTLGTPIQRQSLTSYQGVGSRKFAGEASVISPGYVFSSTPATLSRSLSSSQPLLSLASVSILVASVEQPSISALAFSSPADSRLNSSSSNEHTLRT